MSGSRPRRRVGLGLALGLVAATLWGLAPVATKGALAGYTPETINVLRLAVAAGSLRCWARAPAPWLPRDGWTWIAGVALALDFILYNYGMKQTSASMSGVVINVEAVSTIAFAVWLLHERLTGRRILGSCITLLGVAFVTDIPGSLAGVATPGRVAGNAMVMLAGISWSLYAVGQRLAPRRGSLVAALAPVFTVSALTTTPLLLMRQAWDNTGGLAPTVMLIILVGLCTIMVYLVYSAAQEFVEVSTLAIVLSTIPMFAIVFAHMVLSEPLSSRLVAAGLVVLVGVAVIATEPQPHPVPAAA